MKKKKIALAVAAVGLLGALAVGQTLAWFTDKDSVSNNMVLNHVDIEIDEPNYNEEDYQSLIPGDPIMKDLTVTLADGSSDAWVRLKAPVVEVGDKTFPLFNEDGTANWANDTGVEAVNWTVDCINNGVTPKESVNTSIEDLYTEFAAGKYAMSIGSGVRLSTVRDAATFDGSTIQITTIPGNTIIDGWFAGIWSGSENKEMAGKFLEKMYSPESDQKWVELGGQAPCRKSTVENLEITDSNRYLETMIQAFEEGWLPSNEMPFVGWKYDLNPAVQKVVTDGADPLAALEECEDNFNTANDR